MITKPGSLYSEPHRPQLHFSPPQNWLNDPNGMLYYNGLYHLFFQYNPYDKIWGNMSWGHATSTDLIHWKNKEVALLSEPEGLGDIFSGSAVVDWHNTSGLQNSEHPPLVAIFTHSSRDGVQVQSLAYSLDGSETWQMYADNPVLAMPDRGDFRDPKVFWDKRQAQWVMVLAAHDIIQFYRSSNLLDWQHFLDFGEELGCHDGVWECPDLFPLALPCGSGEKWVLIVSINPGGPNHGSATQYFIGDFDGHTFTHDHDETLWMDYGPDNYAGVTWSDMPVNDKRKILIGWMSNWHYAHNLPTAPWRGAMTIPRELFLVDTSNGPRLASAPIAEIKSLYNDFRLEYKNVSVNTIFEFDGGAELEECLDIKLHVDWAKEQSDEWFLSFHNTQGEELLLDFKASTSALRVDRIKARYQMEQFENFNFAIKAPIDLEGRSNISLRIIKDVSSVEIFLEDGRSLLTLNYFTEFPLNRLQLHSGHKDIPIEVRAASVQGINGIWDHQPC